MPLARVISRHLLSMMRRTVAISPSWRRRSASNMYPYSASSVSFSGCREPHRSKSRGVMYPCLPANTCEFCRSCCSASIVSTMRWQNLGAMRHRSCRMVTSSTPGMSSTCSSKNRLRNACDSGLRPPYNPAGFCVANNIKLGCGVTISWVSGMNNSRLSSSRRFNASNTSEGARFSSSRMIQYPFRTASTNAPS